MRAFEELCHQLGRSASCKQCGVRTTITAEARQRVLLGPRVVRGDRWTAGAVAFGAAILGTVAGSVLLAASLTGSQARSAGEALVFSVGGGLVFAFFAAVPAVVVALPATLLWAALVRASASRWCR